MALYTHVDSLVLKELLSNYDLGKVLEFQPMAGGQANSSVTLSTEKGVYILSVCDEKNADEVASLTTTLIYLEKHDFPSPRLVRTCQDKPFIEYSGKPVYLKHYIEGDCIRSMDASMVFQLGESLARLHAIEPPASLPQTYPYGIECFDEIIDAPLKNPFQRWIREKRDYLQNALSTDLPKGFIHGDLFYDNTLFANGRLAAILDFEEACHTYTVFDIGMCAVGCCSLDGLFTMELIQAMVSGYQSLKKLTDEEKKQLPVFIELAAVATAFWRFRQYHIRRPELDKADTYLEMKSLADQIHALPEKTFLKLVFKS